jgi:hypothetical protein
MRSRRPRSRGIPRGPMISVSLREYTLLVLYHRLHSRAEELKHEREASAEPQEVPHEPPIVGSSRATKPLPHAKTVPAHHAAATRLIPAQSTQSSPAAGDHFSTHTPKRRCPHRRPEAHRIRPAVKTAACRANSPAPRPRNPVVFPDARGLRHRATLHERCTLFPARCNRLMGRLAHSADHAIPKTIHFAALPRPGPIALPANCRQA